MLQPSSMIDMDAVGPAGPTSVPALVAAGTNGGAFLLAGITLISLNNGGVYNTNSGLGNGLGYDSINNQMVLVAPNGGFNGFNAEIDLLVPTTEFGIAIGDWVGAMSLEFRLAGIVVGTITTTSYLLPDAKFFQSQVPFDQVFVSTSSGAGNWVIPELYIQNGFATLATNTAIGAGCGGLSLAANSRPVIGSSWDLSLTGIPATGTVGLEIWSVTDPGINDLIGIGMPGCGLRASPEFLSAFLVTGNSHAYSWLLPSSAAIIGVHVFTTAAVFENPPSNSFGAITSNAIDGKFGDV
ncbi:MAG: hypothetical protein ACJA0V_003006 [Planctomycetota bacterium]|jgi:hypothetical protein